MPDREITRHLRKMRRNWDHRARENARHYIATGQADWTDAEFFASGEQNIQQYVLSDLENVCQGRDPRNMTVLEIGCGAGRLTRALAARFGQVYAVDISAEMVRRARQALAQFPNAHVRCNNGVDLSVLGRAETGTGGWRERFRRPAPRFDFAFSYVVFQHIPSRAVIENYVREVNRLLRPGGLFKFQVQGSSRVEVQVDESWWGVPFTRREAAEMATRCGFEMRYDAGAGEQYYWLWFFKKGEIPVAAGRA